MASDWKYNSEVIKNGINGGLFEAHNVEEIKKHLIEMAIHPETWQKMRDRCIVDAHAYKPDNVLKTLFNELY